MAKQFINPETSKKIRDTKNLSYSQVQKKYNMSRKTIAKYRKELGIITPSQKIKKPVSLKPQKIKKPVSLKEVRIFSIDYLLHLYELHTGKTSHKIKKNDLIDWAKKKLDLSRTK